MKNTVFLTFLMLLPFASISQKTSQRKFILSIEPNFGVFVTNEVKSWGDYYAGLISGGNIKLSKNFNSTNFGVGLGFYRIVGGEVESFKYYGYAIFKPTVYASLELGNTPKFHRMSFTLNGGFVKGSIENRYKLFVSAGPKINLGAEFEKEKMLNNNLTLDLSKLAKGVYYVLLINNAQMNYKKIIKL